MTKPTAFSYSRYTEALKKIDELQGEIIHLKLDLDHARKSPWIYGRPTEKEIDENKDYLVRLRLHGVEWTAMLMGRVILQESSYKIVGWMNPPEWEERND